jgi:hypothetical protein
MIKQSLFDKIIPLLTWITITFPLWLSPFHPAVVAYFIIIFDLYFFIKSSKTAFQAVIAYQKIKINQKINFLKKLRSLKRKPALEYFIVIPNYKEKIEKLSSTVNTFISNDIGAKNLHLVLAFEEREKEAKEKGEILTKKFRPFFKKIICTYHPLKEGEEPGKASNQTYAVKLISRYVEKNQWSPDQVIITICDADSQLPKNYFSYLTYQFIKDKQRRYHFYWAPVLLYNNFWQLPLFVRIQATLSSILRLAFLEERENLIQISTYSTNLWLLKAVNFWDVDIIPEDWHIYLQAFFKFGDEVKTIPLYTIINSDAVYSGTLFKTLVNRYEQEKRWAWGATDIGYSLKKLFTTPHINLLIKLRKIFYIGETHFLWPTTFFILTVSANIPPLINPAFKRTVLGFFLPQIAGLILTFASIFLIFYIYLDIRIKKDFKQKVKITSLPLLIIQWYLLPVVSFFFSSLPALEAQTRILLGKKIKYQVTEKV